MSNEISIVPLQELRDQLVAARSGFDGWAKAQKESISSLQEKHMNFIQEADEHAQAMNAEKKHFEEAAAELQTKLAQQNEELECLSRELEQMKHTEETWPSKLIKLADEVELLESQKEAQRAELENEEAIKQEKMEALLAFKEKYRKYLGLSFEHPSKDHFKLVFIHIDPLRPTDEFSFVLNVSDKYSVVECSPEIPTMSLLLTEVNSSNDFSMFVRKMRKEFVSLCTT